MEHKYFNIKLMQGIMALGSIIIMTTAYGDSTASFTGNNTFNSTQVQDVATNVVALQNFDVKSYPGESVNYAPTTNSLSAPINNNINATYWAMWGNNKSYNGGGNYLSVAVDAPNIDPSYNVIIASFIITDKNGDYILSTYDPASTTSTQYYTDEQIISFVNKVKAQKRKIIVSLGGEKFHLIMKTSDDVTRFVVQVDKIINKYGFEGIDLDLEGSVTSENPVLLAQAVMQVVNNYRKNNQDFWLTMAPEWGYVIPYGYGCGQWGSHSYQNDFYAKLVNNLGINNINYIWPQTYNQGARNGVCGLLQNTVTPENGMDNFVATLTWAATTKAGFDVNTQGMTGTLMPLIPANKFVIGIPATLGAAGGGMLYVMTPALITTLWTVMKTTYNTTAGGFMNWAADWDATPYNEINGFKHTPWETGRAIAKLIN